MRSKAVRFAKLDARVSAGNRLRIFAGDAAGTPQARISGKNRQIERGLVSKYLLPTLKWFPVATSIVLF